MITLKSLFKTSLIYGIGSAIMRLMTFLLLPFYTNELTNYDDFILVMTTIALLRITYSHGMGDSFLKVYSESENKVVITSTYLIYIFCVIIGASSLLLVVNSVFNAENQSSLLYLLKGKLNFILLIILFDTINYRIVDILRIQNKPIFYMIGQLSGIIMTFITTIYLVRNFNNQSFVDFYIYDQVDAALLAVLFGGIINFILFSPILFNNIILSKFSTEHLQKMFALGMRFFPAALFFVFMAQLDRYLLKLLLDDSSNLIGSYSVGYKLASVPMLLIGAFNLGWQPFYLSNGNNQKARDNYGKVGTILVISMLSVGWIMTLIMPLIVTLDVPFLNNYQIIGERFVEGVKIIPLIITAHIFYAMYIINMPSIYLCNKQNWSPILRMIGAGMNLLLNIILIPKYNIYGAAFATAASYGIMFFVLFYKNKTWMPIQLRWTDILIFSLFITCSIVTLTFNIYGQYIILMVTLFYMLFLLYKHGFKNIILLFK